MSERWFGALGGLCAVGVTYALLYVGLNWVTVALLFGLVGWLYGGRVRRWRRQAENDELTGVANRRPFERALAREWARAVRYNRPLSLLFMDVDDFGMVNKAYGHLMGDQALRVISRQIRQTVRNTDIVARWGGEEFVILLPDTTVDQAVITAERIRRVVESAPVRDRDRMISVTVSMGVAGYPGAVETPSELLRHAIAGQSAAKVQKNAVAVSY